VTDSTEAANPSPSTKGRAAKTVSNADRQHKRYRRNQVVVAWMAALIAALFVAMGLEYSSIWRSYNAHLGPASATEDWITRKLSSYSLDSYDMLIALRRLESVALRHAIGAVSREQLGLQRRQVQSVLAHYGPDTFLAGQVSTHSSFAPAYQDAKAFLDTVAALENGQTSITLTLAAADEAHSSWMLFTQDTIAKEYELRDRMEKTLVAFRPLAMRSAYAAAILWCVGFALFILAVLSVNRLVLGQKARFRRFEVMVASVGHDLRSPLQAIQSAGSLLATKLNDADRMKYGGVVKSAAQRLGRMIDDILTVAREENLTWEMRPIRLRQWFREITTTYEHRAQHKGLAFVGLCQTHFPMIETDPDRLAQCLGNLVDNALKNTDKGGIKVHLTVSTPAKGSSQAMLTIRVRDSGQGIAKEDQERIFNPFERAAGAELAPGLGLGLAIVDNLVRGVGGQIKLGSELGIGSAFTLVLPVQVVKKRLPVETVPVRPSMRGKLAPDDEVEGEGDIEILVVDDDPAICASLSGILREAGFSVDTSSNGNDALRRCLHNDFIAVISDIQMPGMDGFALATAIRAEVRRVPFLIGMTAFEARQRTDQRSAVFDGFLGKPFSEDALLDLVDQALERGRN